VIVELRIAVARIEVGEARGYHSDDVLLDAALLAGASVKHVALGVGEDLSDGLPVTPVDDFAGFLSARAQATDTLLEG